MTTKKTTGNKQPPAAKVGALPIDDKPALAERYAYELAKRSSWQGIGDAALAGDREAIKDLAAMGATFMHNLARDGTVTVNSETAAAAEWLAYIMGMIQGGDEPNAAFGYKQAANRPAEFATLRKQVMIGRHFAMLRAEGEKREVARRIVAEHWKVSPSYAAECADALADPAPRAKRRKK